MKSIFAKITLATVLLLGFLPIHHSFSRLSAGEITVFAAASLSNALTEIGTAYEKQSGDTCHFNFAASSTLARQIREGAPADIFFSADEIQMDALVEHGLIDTTTRRALLGNTLAIVVHHDSSFVVNSAQALLSPQVRRIAIGEPSTVPAGVYAREWLGKLGIWETLSPKYMPCENVRAALAVVESGNADAAIVYNTDALISKRVRVAFRVPASEGPKIIYPLAVVAKTRNREAALQFANYLASPEAIKVFTRYGFIAE